MIARALLALLCSLASTQGTADSSSTVQHAVGTYSMVDHFPKGDVGEIFWAFHFTGDLEAVSRREIFCEPVRPAKCKIRETVMGWMAGRQGSFVIEQGEPGDPVEAIVPGSGGGDFIGIAGKLSRAPRRGKLRYDLTYTLPN